MIRGIGRKPPREDLNQMGILTIDLPDFELADALVAELGDRWACCALQEPELPQAVVFLSPHNASDFAQLTRRVQAWLSERSLGALSFQLRGRAHIHERPAAVVR
jgi:hypothetical protein